MQEKKKYRHIPWNRYNLEKYRDIHFWSYRPALYLYIYKKNNLLIIGLAISTKYMGPVSQTGLRLNQD